jgi:hypothetical protein
MGNALDGTSVLSLHAESSRSDARMMAICDFFVIEYQFFCKCKENSVTNWQKPGGGTYFAEK